MCNAQEVDKIQLTTKINSGAFFLRGGRASAWSLHFLDSVYMEAPLTAFWQVYAVLCSLGWTMTWGNVLPQVGSVGMVGLLCPFTQLCFSSSCFRAGTFWRKALAPFTSSCTNTLYCTVHTNTLHAHTRMYTPLHIPPAVLTHCTVWCTQTHYTHTHTRMYTPLHIPPAVLTHCTVRCTQTHYTHTHTRMYTPLHKQGLATSWGVIWTSRWRSSWRWLPLFAICKPSNDFYFKLLNNLNIAG